MKDFIYYSTASYPAIVEEVGAEKRTVAKSTISYHKKGSQFRSPFHNAAGRDHDVSRLTDREKGYVVGFFAGDGSTRRPSSSQYRVIRFYIHKKEYLLAQHLACILKKANLRPHLIYSSSKNLIVLEVDSKALYNLIRQYLSWENHRKVYTIRLRSTSELLPEFINGSLVEWPTAMEALLG